MLDARSVFDAKHAGGTASAAMSFLGHVDALIVDLRPDGGGEPKLIQLLSSCLLDRTTHLNSIQLRPGERLRQFWTLSYVPGSSLSGAPVRVLTSSLTLSGAEEFIYNLQSYRRATIVGEVTGAGARPVLRFAARACASGSASPTGAR